MAEERIGGYIAGAPEKKAPEMTVRDLLETAKVAVHGELAEARIDQVKERLRELKAAEQVVARLKAQLEELLEEPIDDGVFVG